MLNMDQVHQLESRVEKAVQKIITLSDDNRKLSDENKMLQEQLSSFQTRVAELERSVEAFKEDQGRIEQGILSVLDKLSAVEDTVMSDESDSPQGGEQQGGEGWNQNPNPEGYHEGQGGNQSDAD